MNANHAIEIEVASGIMRPQPRPRRGALRTVTIRPVSLASEGSSADAVAVQGVLPLEDLTEVPALRRARNGAHTTRSRHRRTPEFTDADLIQIARQICRGMAEVVSGDRPASQLIRCTSERVYADITRRSALAKSRRRMSLARTAHTRVERVSIQRPNRKTVEVWARLRQGDNIHALAARLEFISGRWTCVAVDVDRRL